MLCERFLTVTDDEVVAKAQVFVEVTSQAGEEPVLSELLMHLQNSFAKLEKYILFQNSDNSTSSGIKYLTQPIKLQLERGMQQPQYRRHSSQSQL